MGRFVSIRRLTPEMLEEGIRHLVGADPVLTPLIERNGMPPLWSRTPGFPTMVLIILEQQVSLASARAAFQRLQEALAGAVTPRAFLQLGDGELRTIGFSRQKARYVRGLASDIELGHLDLSSLETMSDDDVRTRLLGISGVGPWTAAVYLMFALGRPDVWPPGDRALLVSLGRALGRDTVPASDEGLAVSQRWRPWRTPAAFVLWHDYLGGSSE